MAAAPSSLGAQFSEELSCSICLELFTRPKMLPCGHIFCQDCLRDHVESQGHLKCPNCRRHVKRPRKGVEGLPDNHIVANLCKKLQEQAVLSKEKREEPQPRNKCSFHPSKEARLFCEGCQVPVCSECFEEGHDRHTAMTPREGPQDEVTVQALITEGREILETYCSFIRDLKAKEKGLDDQKQQMHSKIDEAYRQANQKLAEKKDRLLSEVDAKHNYDKGVVQSQRDAVLVDMAELSTVCAYGSEQETSYADDLNLPDVVRKFRAKTLPCPVEIHPAVFEPTDSEDFVCTLGRVTTQEEGTSSGAAAMAIGDPSGDQGHGESYVSELVFDEWGTNPIGSYCPVGVTVSEDGDIFVAEKHKRKINVYDIRGSFRDEFPTIVSDEDKRMDPLDVAIDGEGNPWVVGWMDDDNSQFAVQYEACDGEVLGKFDLPYGSARGVTVDTRRNHILVSKYHSRWLNSGSAVQVFEPDGTLVRTVEMNPYHPCAITVDGEGNILAIDDKGHHVLVYNADGQFLFQFGGKGSGDGRLRNPCGICTDRAGNIIVADKGNKRVEMFDKTGRFLEHIATDMKSPCAVAMGPQGQLVVTDTSDHTVTIFKQSDCG